MKKVLIPILSMAAVAPIATTAVACSSSINMKFGQIDDDQKGFFVEKFNPTFNKKYTFNVNVANATDPEFITRHNFYFYAGNPSSNTNEVEIFKMDKSSIIIKRNGVELKEDGEDTEGQGGKFNSEMNIITIEFDSDHSLTNNDKLTISCVWTEGNIKSDSMVMLIDRK